MDERASACDPQRLSRRAADLAGHLVRLTERTACASGNRVVDTAGTLFTQGP